MTKDSFAYYMEWPDDEIICAVTNAGAFRCNGIFGPPYHWKFCQKYSDDWNAIEQRIRNHRSTQLEPHQLPDWLPEVPPVPKGLKPLPLTARLTHAEPVPTGEYPAAAAYIAAAGAVGREVHLILDEDTYESTYGDGVYRYLHRLFLKASEAAMHEQRSEDGWYVYTHRTVRLKVNNGLIRAIESDDEIHDTVSLTGVVSALEAAMQVSEGDAT